MRGLIRHSAAGALLKGRALTAGQALVLLFVGTGIRCLYVGTVQHASQPTSTGILALAAVCFAVAATVALRSPRVDGPVGWVLVVGLIVITTALVGVAPTRADAIIRSIGYPWSALFAALFMSRRAARNLALLTAAALALGIAVAGLPDMVSAWVLMTVTVLAVTAATSGLVEALRVQSETDSLTGLANRAGFMRLATQAVNASTRQQRAVAIVVCDIDGLKLINDRDGHAEGDKLLRAVTAAWLTTLRASDVFARLGGDEFAVLLPDGDVSSAEYAVQRMRLATPSAFSAGVASSEPGDSLDDLLTRADLAMYADKAARRASKSLPAQRPASSSESRNARIGGLASSG